MNRIEPTTLQFWPSFTLQFWPSFSRIVCLFSQVFRPLLCIRRFFFFFYRDLRSRSDGANSPIRIRHSERQLISFRSRTLRGCDNETFNAHTRVSCNFGQFEPIYKQIERLGFVAKIASFSFDRLPSGPFLTLRAQFCGQN